MLVFIMSIENAKVALSVYLSILKKIFIVMIRVFK